MTATKSVLALDDAALNLLFRDARSPSAFLDQPVDDATLQAIYELARYGPTSLNQQPLRIVAVRSEPARHRLLRHVHEGNLRKARTAPLILILAADTNFHERLPEVFPHVPQLRETLAADVAGRTAQARFNAILQIGYLIVAIRAAGLAAGPMIGFDAPAVAGDFFPQRGWEPLLLMNVGHGEPKGRPRLPRLDYSDVVSTF
jgi:3-hydroxypropanoate dehydrogenase